jgi:hypoxanthine phosphoribosyltransferase
LRPERQSILGLVDTWQRVVALAILVLEAFLLAVLARSEKVEWYVVLLGVTPLIVLILGVFFGPRSRPKSSAQNGHDIAPKVRLLTAELADDQFRPDLIVGLSRGGLMVAARLSYELAHNPPVPTVSLWPHAHDYDNPLNSFDLAKIYEMQKNAHGFNQTRLWNVLIVDDACNSGRSLDGAKRYVKNKLSEIPSRIRTAALEIKRGVHSTMIAPDFYASAELKSTDAWGDDEE